MAKSALGKGLGDLFAPSSETPTLQEGEIIITAPIDRVSPDPDQHRKVFHDETLEELASSIRIHGVIQPLLVRKFGSGYQIIAGERRYRASKLAGLTEIPVIVKDYDDRKAQEAALIENLQREDLNPIDEANGYAALMHRYELTQEQAAKQIGKSRAAVANSLRLLKLPVSAQSLLKQGIITAGHARALIPLEAGMVEDMLLRIVDRDMTVRQVEEAVRQILEGDRELKKPQKTGGKNQMVQSQMKEISHRASTQLGRRVSVKDDGSGRGKITLEYFDTKDLEEILVQLCGEEFLLNLN